MKYNSSYATSNIYVSTRTFLLVVSVYRQPGEAAQRLSCQLRMKMLASMAV